MRLSHSEYTSSLIPPVIAEQPCATVFKVNEYIQVVSWFSCSEILQARNSCVHSCFSIGMWGHLRSSSDLWDMAPLRLAYQQCRTGGSSPICTPVGRSMAVPSDLTVLPQQHQNILPETEKGHEDVQSVLRESPSVQHSALVRHHCTPGI